MRKILSLLVPAILLGVCGSDSLAADGEGEGVHLFILSGQSNMARLDPAVSFTPAVESKFGKSAVLVVKDAQGGQPIRRWDRDWKSVASAEHGDLYTRLMEKVNAARKGRNVRSVTFLWMQGERDAKEGNAGVYGESLERVVARLRKDLEWEDLHVIIGRLSDFDLANARYPQWTKLREVQEKLADENKGWAWVDTDDLNGGKNDLHLTAEGYRILGERFAEKATALIER